MVSSSDTLCTYILYGAEQKSINILSKKYDNTHNMSKNCSEGLKCIFRCNFYIFLQSKLVQIQQSLCNIGFAYSIFIEAH